MVGLSLEDENNDRVQAPKWWVTIILRVDTAAISIQKAEEIPEVLRRKPHGGHQTDASLTIYRGQSGLASGVAMTTGLC